MLITIEILLAMLAFISCIFILKKSQEKTFFDFKLAILKTLQENQEATNSKISQLQIYLQPLIQESIAKNMQDIREQLQHSFKNHAQSLTSHLESLNNNVQEQLNSLTAQVHVRLTEGFEKTSATFTDVVKRLALIDEAQKKITELSSHVVNLKDILVDKKARGAFGEVQLASLIKNMMPAQNFAFQYTLKNQKRADCILFLPKPSGNIVIDSKFPLETYQRIYSEEVVVAVKSLKIQFSQDIKKHISDISDKYILPPDTADGAIMFIPAESIFAEIHANYPELITFAQQKRVWLTSPTTLMAVLTTARAVLKDDSTKKQVHIIQKHLHGLAADFGRFEKRMDKLSRHISQARQDVEEVHTSAKKITERFYKIEAVEISDKAKLEDIPAS